ncbi:MAG: hypothetical protein J3K34DRAFT_403401 [Monoraphidium minutum]|nr:MAG: hypothetical protein J3K34DRAFT_403401 [Monoraphidium minutum]
MRSGSAVLSRLARRTLEFPSVHPDWTGLPHRHVYCGGDAVDDATYWAPLQVLCRVSVDPAAGLDSPLDFERDAALQTW